MPDNIAADTVVGDHSGESKCEQVNEKERLTLRIPKTLYDRLEEIQKTTHASTVNEVVKNALLFYDALVQERLQGNDVLVISPDGEKTKYSVFL